MSYPRRYGGGAGETALVDELDWNNLIRTNDGLGGTIRVDAGGTMAVVTHGLLATPDAGHIVITPLDDLGGKGWWVDTVGAVSFNLHVSGMDLVDHDFKWGYAR